MNNDKQFPMDTHIAALIKSETCEHCIFNAGRTYMIPEYQRDYSWGEKEIERFMDSIKKAVNGEQVFMGTVQFDLEGEEYHVIDGQQRMTTFLLLFSVIDENCILDNNIKIKIKNFNSNNKKLEEALAGKAESEEDNRYLQNKNLIKSFIDEIKAEPAEIIKDIKNNIYFVELITKDIPLPSVVGIFNTINTTGLDLNCADMFKLQYYEYLKAVDSNGDWMHKISELYEEANQADGCEMSDILDVYKHCIAAKNKWSFEMLSKSSEVFFSEVFEKQKDCDKEILSFCEFERLVKLYIDFYGKYTYLRSNDMTKHLIDPIDAFAMDLIGMTRYGRYWTLQIVSAYFDTEPDKMKKYANALHTAAEISKYFIVCSVNYDRAINPVNTFVCNEVLPALTDKKDVIGIIQNAVKEAPYEWERDNETKFCGRIKNNLMENGKRAHIVCVLSALMTETADGSFDCKDVSDKFFAWKNFKYDNEHIYARKLFAKEEIPKEEQAEYNGIGNLTVLERKINRGIGDMEVEEKAEKYDRSNFKIVKNLISDIKNNNYKWDIEAVRKRAKEQEKMLCEFLFSNNRQTGGA